MHSPDLRMSITLPVLKPAGLYKKNLGEANNSAKLKTCHPTNIKSVKDDLYLAQQHKGQTLFELIVDIIRTHQHIELDLS